MPESKPKSIAYHWFATILRGDQAPWPRVENGPDVDLLWQVGLENGVLTLCHYLLSGTPAWDNLPDTFQNQLAAYAKQEAATELLRKQQLGEIFDRFRDAKLDFLLMKGTPLAYSLYPEPYLRNRCDTDLLFSDKQTAEDAWKILDNLGYKRPNAISGEFISNEFCCYKPGDFGPINTIDLHWKLNNSQRFARIFSFEELHESAIKVPELNNDVLALAPTHALLLACMHRIAHQPEGLENRLIWLYDIHLLLNGLSNSQQEEFISVTLDKGLCRITLDGFKQAERVFNTCIPEDIKERLEAGADQEDVDDDIGKSRLAMEISNFQSLPGMKERLSLLKEHLLPDPDYMLKKYQTKSYLLLPFFYIVRAIGGIKKLIGN